MRRRYDQANIPCSHNPETNRWLARNEPYRKHAMHAVAAFTLLGLLGTIGGLIRLLGGTTTPAAISQGLTAILTGTLLALCVKSFIDARRRQARG